MKGSFPLFRINWRYSWTAYSGDVDKSNNGNLLEIYYNADSVTDYYSECNSNNNGKETVCYNLFNDDLKFETFCISCKNFFKKIFSKTLHLISNKDF